MREAGCDTVIDAHEISVLGLAEVVRHLPHIYGEYRRLLREVDARKPDAAILIDFPDFNLRLARQLHKRGIPVIYYVSPQLWAWRAGRIAQIRKYVRKMLVIFPFEEKWYRERGVEAEYVGHPLADPGKTRAVASAVLESPVQRSRIIALLPGSRRKEVETHLPIMLQAVAKFDPSYRFVIPIAQSLDKEWFESLLRRQCPRGWESKISTHGQRYRGLNDRPCRRGRLRHRHPRNRAHRHSLRDGLSRLASQLDAWPSAGQGRPLCHA